MPAKQDQTQLSKQYQRRPKKEAEDPQSKTSPYASENAKGLGLFEVSGTENPHPGFTPQML